MQLSELNLDRNLYKTDTQTEDINSTENVSSTVTPVPVADLSSGAAANDVNTNSKNIIADKLDSGTITSKKIMLAVIPDEGDVYLAAGKTDFNNNTAGFILGVDDTDDLPKFYIGNNTNYLNWTGGALNISGSLNATSGTIGGFTIGASEMYGGIIKTAATVEAGSTGVIMDTNGLRGYDSVLGNTFNLPTDGSSPTFASGIINSTIFNVQSGAVIRTSSTVGDGSANSAGILINNTGLYGVAANQTLADANVKVLVDGTAVFNASIRGGQTDFDTGTGYFLGLSSGDYKFSIGNQATNYLTWDGTYLKIKGSFDVGSTGIINNSTYTVANLPIPPQTIGPNVPSAYDTNAVFVVTSYSESNKDSTDAMGPGGIVAEGQLFNNSTNIILDSCKFYIQKSGSPSGNVYAKLYSVSNGKPGTLLATSDAVNVSSFSTSFALRTFTFSGAERYLMVANTNYFIVYSDHTGTGSNFVYMGYDGSSPTYAGYAVRSSTEVTWNQYSNWDFPFYIYGTLVDFTNPGNIYSSNNSYATLTASSGVVTVEVSKDAGVNWSAPLTKTFGGSDTLETYGLGATELWGLSWTRADMVNANFYIRVSNGVYSQVYKTYGFSTGADILTGVEVAIEGNYSNPTISLDLLEVTIHYGSSTLPVQAGSQSFATNGRKNGEGAGAGTGVLVFYDGTNWKACDTGATVAA